MAFDLADLAQSDTADMDVIHPLTGEPIPGDDGKPWTITFAGPGHAKTVALKNKTMRAVFKAQRQRRRGDPEPEEVERETVEYLADRIVGWGTISFGGAAYPYSHANALALLGKAEFGWLRAQCNQFLVDEASFLKRSATS